MAPAMPRNTIPAVKGAATAEDVEPKVEGSSVPGRGRGLPGGEGREDGDEHSRRDHRGRVDVPRDGGRKPRAVRGDRGVPGELGDDREGSEEQEGGDDEALAGHGESLRQSVSGVAI